MADLLPCPFCGSPHVLLGTIANTMNAVLCQACYAVVGWERDTPKDEVVEAWNRRAAVGEEDGDR
jgi:Lar family restriction alleviation protein